MLEQLCAEIKNYFTYEEDKHLDTFTIENGIITPSIDFATDYIRIVGSRKNDGIHKVSALSLQDETFHGAIWVMSPPKAFLELANDIQKWMVKNGAVVTGPYSSESFGGYSYTRATDGTGKPISWQTAFASRLNAFRRIRV